ncbi:hypothetical protein R3W88_027547 [Solanum pinnatisectum]|uniref:Pectinesterase inhibitor domain-containing protein n=1 Tax=Solanum pinnatisectum TaxID=50273 RepID=A0AAV9LHK2_9SOLN|nr:hypothetical protein R3W88_027547 [Solanum pinnatisectum]
MKALSVIFIFFLSLVTFSLGDLIEDVCQRSSDFKVCIDALRADPKSSSTDKKYDATSAIKYFDANDFLAARTSTTAIASAPDTCEETFNESPLRISPIKSKDDDFMNFIGLTMSLLNQFKN